MLKKLFNQKPTVKKSNIKDYTNAHENNELNVISKVQTKFFLMNILKSLDLRPILQ